ncbi:uncharacterized protein NFIA_069190 [Aspergillus fischeri NRRL 181]|uniref:Uncharacterized protein n=1 Tax=Neosartorya fischeri (strain ATCC 1020 / DSM 3700 / CBS 544.65 / FGSC A1164 / JCM 1740 / NRRL 181 / WB 181) TaxID=331117 RepID=A1D7Q4_NEOFI|nr:uncharacterized protein NFIA_069190 [Aspergillus fischeri NRRL 181]EAW21748.1 hypothetical protein NFIA_069190 [Aspergillus fischeri NRRL 181]
MPPSNNNNNTPRPWGSQYSTGQRNCIQGAAFMESDDEEGLAWQHVEDISILTPEEKDFSTGATGRNRENGFKNGGISGSGSAEAGGSKMGIFGSAKEGGSKKSFFGFGAKGKGKGPAGKN